jgi:hypothetical protein
MIGTKYQCLNCDTVLSSDHVVKFTSFCHDCRQNVMIRDLANELREARITFEELFRKILAEVDK